MRVYVDPACPLRVSFGTTAQLYATAWGNCAYCRVINLMIFAAAYELFKNMWYATLSTAYILKKYIFTQAVRDRRFCRNSYLCKLCV